MSWVAVAATEVTRFTHRSPSLGESPFFLLSTSIHRREEQWDPGSQDSVLCAGSGGNEGTPVREVPLTRYLSEKGGEQGQGPRERGP